MKHTRQDVIRMAGHLLLHHPTTFAWARTTKGRVIGPEESRASCFCLWGAIHACDIQLMTGLRWYRSAYDTMDDYEGVVGWDQTAWDEATPRARRAYAERMANYTEGEVLR